jgi:uncharacterized membrane protein YciS (DUF1049 family)
MEAKMFISNIKLGLVEINATFFFQIFNTLFLIGLIVLMVFFVKFVLNNYNNHKKLELIENQLKRVEEGLESSQKYDK